MDAMSGEAEKLSYLERKWDAGERHLVAGRYVSARRDLEAAEAVAWRRHDARSLARIYLPLLEARRQIRYIAAEGTLVIGSPDATAAEEQNLLRHFLRKESGTILLASHATGAAADACRYAGSVQCASRRSGRCLEALILLARNNEVRLASQADPTFAAGLTVQWRTDANELIGPSTDPHLVIPLPPLGTYHPGGPLHPVARESLIVAWEALALYWQHRHPSPHNAQPWDEIAWLRLALRIDPACEPITMRLVSLAETLERSA